MRHYYFLAQEGSQAHFYVTECEKRRARWAAEVRALVESIGEDPEEARHHGYYARYLMVRPAQGRPPELPLGWRWSGRERALCPDMRTKAGRTMVNKVDAWIDGWRPDNVRNMLCGRFRRVSWQVWGDDVAIIQLYSSREYKITPPGAVEMTTAEYLKKKAAWLEKKEAAS